MQRRVFLAELSEADEKRFFSLSLEYLKHRFGKENIKLATVHRDERGKVQSHKGGNAHMHVDIVPVTNDGRLTAKELLNRQALIDIQTELPQYLSQNGFDIIRGEKGSKATHMKMDDFKREADKQKKVLIQEYNALVDKYDELQKYVEDMKAQVKELSR